MSNYENFSTFASGGTVTQLADGNFLAVWTDITMDGTALLYGQVFKPDGTTLRDKFSIQTGAASQYAEPTAVTLADGRTLVAWTMSGANGSIIQGKILDANHQVTGGLSPIDIGPEEVASQVSPRIQALANGGYSVFFNGEYKFTGEADSRLVLWNRAYTQLNGNWGFSDTIFDPNTNSITTLPNENFVSVTVNSTNGNSVITSTVWSGSTSSATTIDTVPGFTGVHPTVAPLANGFVVAWEDVSANGATHFLHAQVFNGQNQAVGGEIHFTKPAGTIEEAPIIRQLSNGGFAIAFKMGANGDNNVYVAASTADGAVLMDTASVGHTTAGVQRSPSLSALPNGTFAVGWINDDGTTSKLMTEVYGVSGPGTTGGGTPSGGRPPVVVPPTSGSIATAGNDQLTGTVLGDALNGLAGNDTIDGKAGDDTLTGGLGKDTLKGDAGKDVFVFDTKPSKANIDTIADFSAKDDSIWLENKVFTGLGKKGSLAKPAQLAKDAFWVGVKAHDASDRILYDKAKGALYYDADGTGAKAAVQIATLSKKLALTSKDFFVI